MEIGLSELVTPRQFMNRAIQLARVGEGVEKLAPGIMCNRTTLTLSRRCETLREFLQLDSDTAVQTTPGLLSTKRQSPEQQREHDC